MYFKYFDYWDLFHRNVPRVGLGSFYSNFLGRSLFCSVLGFCGGALARLGWGFISRVIERGKKVLRLL
jgi:hypothetical protein